MTSASELQGQQLEALRQLGINAEPHPYMNNIVVSPKGADKIIKGLQTLAEIRETRKEVASG